MASNVQHVTNEWKTGQLLCFDAESFVQKNVYYGADMMQHEAVLVIVLLLTTYLA